MSLRNISLREKTIWITGASAGIGEQLALHYAQTGARLILSARRMNELQRVQQLCASPENVTLIKMDQEDETSVRQAANEVLHENNGIDYLILCGGISQRSRADETSLTMDRKIFETNFFSHVLLTKLLLPSMKKRGKGTIVVISSLTGKWGFYLRSTYAASKHALHGFYDSLRMEVAASHIQITLVTPGFIATKISENALNSSGNPTGEMDTNQLNGMSPQRCAAIIVRKVQAGKTEFAVGGKETFGLLLQRFFPVLFKRILRRQSAK